jgi:hypothetical protein
MAVTPGYLGIECVINNMPGSTTVPVLMVSRYEASRCDTTRVCVCVCVCCTLSERTDIHNIVLRRIEEQPVIEQCQLGIGRYDIGLDTSKQPPDDSESRNHIRAQQLVRWVVDTTNEANQIHNQRLLLWIVVFGCFARRYHGCCQGRWEVTCCQPLLIPLLTTIFHLHAG